MRRLRRALLQIRANELAHRYAKIFRAYPMEVTGHTPQTLKYGLRQDGQYRLHDELSPFLSNTISFEAVYQVRLVCDGRQLLPPKKGFVLKYRNGVRPTELYAPDIDPDTQYLCFEQDPRFEGAVRQAVEGSGK